MFEMQNILKILASAALFLFSCLSVGATPSRAWLATKNGKAIVLNAETHLKTEFEFDESFEELVYPAFRDSDIAFIEGYPEEQSKKLRRLANLCSQGNYQYDLLESRIKILAQALLKLGIPNFVPENWKSSPPEVIRAVYFENLLDPAVDRALFGAEKNIKRQKYLWPIGFELAFGDRAKPKTILPLDDYDLLHKDFCESSAHTKEGVLISDAENIIAKLAVVKNANVEKHLINFLKSAQEDYIRALISISNDTPFELSIGPDEVDEKSAWNMRFNEGSVKYYLLDRNMLWRQRIIAASSYNKNVFVSLGVLHLLDVKFGSKVYPGLISMLRKAGYDIRPVER